MTRRETQALLRQRKEELLVMYRTAAHNPTSTRAQLDYHYTRLEEAQYCYALLFPRRHRPSHHQQEN